MTLRDTHQVWKQNMPFTLLPSHIELFLMGMWELRQRTKFLLHTQSHYRYRSTCCEPVFTGAPTKF